MSRTRQGLSLSLAGHCRMELWLIEHSPEKADTRSLTGTRTVQVGMVIESLMFETKEVETAYGKEEIGGWFYDADPIRDPVTGYLLDPKKATVENRQLKVSHEIAEREIFGSLDAMIKPNENEPWMVGDCKSANGWVFDRAKTSPLVGETFSHEYVIQQQMYMGGVRNNPMLRSRYGLVPAAGLIYFNKEQSQLLLRVLGYDPDLEMEGRERLASGMQDAEPTPDYEWSRDAEIPLRCSYCDMKTACAEVRGYALEFGIKGKAAKPFWIVRGR